MKLTLTYTSNGRKLQINSNRINFGRSVENDIRINSVKVSKKHCQIIYKDRNYYLIDLNTGNGTFLNNNKINFPERLSNGDIISFPGNSFGFIVNILNDNNIPARHRIFRVIFIALITGLLIPAVFFLMIFLNKKHENKIRGLKDDIIRQRFYQVLVKYGENPAFPDEEILRTIKTFIQYYQNSQTLKQGLERREKYNEIIKNTFEEYNIPQDLSYIAFVESNYDPEALNKYSGARGMWQLMKPTAIQYGLKVNAKVDERTDPEKSTKAAAAYINDLLSIFGIDSFLLTIAAYNAGDGNLRLALRKIKNPKTDRNFWYLYKNDLIPDETKNYVCKVLALIILCEEYDKNEEEKN